MAYMEDICIEECVIPILRFVWQLGADIEGGIHTTKLKIRILSVFPDLRAHLQWRAVLLTFLDDIGDNLIKAYDRNSDTML